MDRKTIFSAVKAARAKLLPDGGAFNVTEVAVLDDCLDRLNVPRDGLKPAASDSAFIATAIEHLRFEEGVRPRAYKDHLGCWTIGVGRLIDERKGGRLTAEETAKLIANDRSRQGKPVRQWVLDDAEIDLLLANDIARFVAAMADWPAWQAVQGNVARMVAMLSMCFQMGEAGFAGFRNTLGLIAEGKFGDAAANMLRSKWAEQTPARAKRVAEMMRTGK